MQIVLIFGFLGAGKTTLVKRLLANGVQGVKTAVIVNEFGAVGVDGSILEGESVEMIELNDGCLCCTLKGSLTTAIDELRKTAGIERIIVEATGIAQPAELIEPLVSEPAGGDIRIGPFITVLDAAKFHQQDSMLGEFLDLQIKKADVLVLNKRDLAGDDVLADVQSRIEALNPFAPIVVTEQCQTSAESLLAFPHLPPLLALPQQEAGLDTDTAPEPRPTLGADERIHGAVSSFSLDSSMSGSRADAVAFFSSLPESVWRAKGYMHLDGQLSLVQYVMGQLDISAVSSAQQRLVVFIGRDMDRRGISGQFRFSALYRPAAKQGMLSRVAA